jgi:hypothetical protein
VNVPFTDRFGVNLSAGTVAANSGTVVFSNSNSVSFGMSLVSSSYVITMSASGVVGGGIGSFSAGTATISSGTVVLANSNGIDFGLSGQTVTAGFPALSAWNNFADIEGSWSITTGAAISNLSLQRANIELPIAATRVDLAISMTAAASQQGTYTLSIGIYSFAHSTASSLSSASISVSWTSGANAAASAYGGQSGILWRSISLGTWNITPGDYLIGLILSNSAPAGTTIAMSVYGNQIGSLLGLAGGGNFSSYFDSGFYSATTTAFPSSIQLSEIAQTCTIASTGIFQQYTAQMGYAYLNFAGTF